MVVSYKMFKTSLRKRYRDLTEIYFDDAQQRHQLANAVVQVLFDSVFCIEDYFIPGIEQ